MYGYKCWEGAQVFSIGIGGGNGHMCRGRVWEQVVWVQAV